MSCAEIVKAVEGVYLWIDSQGIEHVCAGCGDCCNFSQYDHLLFVTGVELLHFRESVGEGNLKSMDDGVCPYMVDGKCSVYSYRFAGCRIFQCKGNDDLQGEVMEKALAMFKEIGKRFRVSYLYVDLAKGLASL